MKNFVRIIIASAVLAVAVPAHATIDLLLSIPGVDGFGPKAEEYMPPDLPDDTKGTWNVVDSFEAGYDQDGCNEVTIQMGTNAATAQIIANGIMGTSNPQIYLHAVGSSGDIGGGSLPKVYYTLHNGVITSVVNSGSEGDEKIGTTIIIIPASITVETFVQKLGGKADSTGEVTISCSDKKKKKVK